MFKKTTNYLKKNAKSVLSSGRLKTLALMLLVGGGVAMAQNSAGDYTAGTTALTTVTEESGRKHFCQNIILRKYHISKLKTHLK